MASSIAAGTRHDANALLPTPRLASAPGANAAPPPTPLTTVGREGGSPFGPRRPLPVQNPPHSPYAPPASAATPTLLHTAKPPAAGTASIQTDAPGPTKGTSRTPTALSSAQIGKNHAAAVTPQPAMHPNTSAPAAAIGIMELRAVLELRKLKPRMPYHISEWVSLLEAAGFTSKYPELLEMFHNGFHAGVPAITTTHTPSNASI
ncbi:hypothetical protein Agabi119p4_5021 [Agaricus bisporus var. burnettii]|uniref:Uncharacterized protein n=1 Tax=Agaricus bisporus var. burnettii TaxID=192524 RepID=A0A8H7KHY1_AGABI|nr:hypothetical protein Agabi119p4_5021 [Agaricus bisporus var. burnettii]